MRILAFRGWALAALSLIPWMTGCAGNDLPADAAPAEILAHAEAKLSAEKYLDAVESLEYFLRTYPGTGSTPVAKLRLGDARYGLREYILAEGEYRQVVSDYPASPHVEEARFKIARCSYASIRSFDLDQTETERAVAELEEFLRDYPDSRWAGEARDAIADCRGRLAHGEFENGRFYADRKQYKPAAIQYKYVVNSFPETPWAPRSAFHLAGLYADRERWDEAETWYRRVSRDWPDSEEAAASERRLREILQSRTLSQVPEEEDSP